MNDIERIENILNSLFGYPYKPVPAVPEDFLFYIPGNTAIEQRARERMAEASLHRGYDRYTEVPVTQFSSPHGMPIKFYKGHTTTGQWYLKSSVGPVKDSKTGNPVGPVEAYIMLSGENPPERELFVKVHKLYREAYLHEADENFYWNGEQLLNPHEPENIKKAP